VNSCAHSRVTLATSTRYLDSTRRLAFEENPNRHHSMSSICAVT
jgi:hypothetical protein